MLRLITCLLFVGSALAQIENAVNPVMAQAKAKAAEMAGGGVTLQDGSGETETQKSFTVETGASKGLLRNLNDIPPCAGAIVFGDVVCGADGKIGFWQMYTYGPGDVCLGVFKKVKTKTGDVLLESAGRNCLTVNSNVAQFMEVEIPPVQQISVKPTDVVAIYYPGATCDPMLRVVSVESTNYPASAPGSPSLSRVTVIPDPDIQPGSFYPEAPYFTMVNGQEVEYKALPSFKAVVMGMSHVLDLRGGEDSRSGVAMIFMNNVWGTMCDRWYHEKGWPYLFCAEKDFPDTEMLYYTDTPERHQVPWDTPIHLKNPRCKFSENVTMFSCATHDNVTCNHTNDIFIRCKSKVELRKGPVPSEGIAYVYESNYWGTVCDADGPPMDENGNLHIPSEHWAQVVCRSRGFAGCANLTWAKDENIPENQSVGGGEAVSMHSPICSGGAHGSDIKQCADGPPDKRCTHAQDLYLRCQLGQNI